jgi:succinyl-CoA synthetase beta subunit
MKLFEYQAKELFEERNIPIPNGMLIDGPWDLHPDHIQLPCVVKAQVLQGGRGKAGLIQFATTFDEAYQKAKQMMNASTYIHKLLIEEALPIKQELYLSLTVDPVSGQAMVMACANGGIDIEEIARNRPEQIIKEYIDLSSGLMPFQARNVMYSLGLKNSLVSKGVSILTELYHLFRQYEAELIEINPLVITTDDRLVALDGKMTLDDNALSRHNRFTPTREYFESEAQYKAALEGIPYLEFDGDIGLMCAGAGLTNAVFDLVHYYGGSVASYLEFGGPNYHKALKAMNIILQNKPKVILIVTFGTIARADVMAKGVVEAIEQLHPDIPIVTAIRGTGEEEAWRILQSAGLDVLTDTEEAVQKAVQLAGGKRS